MRSSMKQSSCRSSTGRHSSVPSLAFMALFDNWYCPVALRYNFRVLCDRATNLTHCPQEPTIASSKFQRFLCFV